GLVGRRYWTVLVNFAHGAAAHAQRAAVAVGRIADEHSASRGHLHALVVSPAAVGGLAPLIAHIVCWPSGAWSGSRKKAGTSPPPGGWSRACGARSACCSPAAPACPRRWPPSWSPGS